MFRQQASRDSASEQHPLGLRDTNVASRNILRQAVQSGSYPLGLLHCILDNVVDHLVVIVLTVSAGNAPLIAMARIEQVDCRFLVVTILDYFNCVEIFLVKKAILIKNFLTEFFDFERITEMRVVTVQPDFFFLAVLELDVLPDGVQILKDPIEKKLVILVAAFFNVVVNLKL